MKFIGFYSYTVVLTYLSLISSVLGILLASRGEYTAAITSLLLSGVCDAFDGIVARSKKNRTDDEKAFGIQLDSLCDVICFGIFPSYLCFCLGVNSIVGVLMICAYNICAVIRLAFFNVLEGNRQKTEGGCNKTYRGLPVTSISVIFPFLYFCFYFTLSKADFTMLLQAMLPAVAFLFILDFPVKKPDWASMLTPRIRRK